MKDYQLKLILTTIIIVVAVTGFGPATSALVY